MEIAAFATARVSRIGPSARIQPIRTPGAISLLIEFSSRVRSLIPGSEAIGAQVAPVKVSSP